MHSVHWYPPGGGGGPKMRHLVLYKLAGFSPADRRRRRAFFHEHTPPLENENCQKSAKKCTFWPPKPPKMAILALFCPFFREFWREIPRGRGDPFFRGDPPGGGGPGPRAEPPPGRGARRARGGGVKKTQSFFNKKNHKDFFSDPTLLGHRAITGIQQAISCMTV